MHPQNRDVAQLVAHYVRDVGVGRSSRLIPTESGKGKYSFAAFLESVRYGQTSEIPSGLRFRFSMNSLIL